MLGAVLLVFSAAGLYLNSAASLPLKSLLGLDPQQSGEVIVLRRVYQPARAAPTGFSAAVPPAASPALPTSTPINAPSTVPTGTPSPASARTASPTNDGNFLVPGTPPPTAIPMPSNLVPNRIIIPAIHLDAPVIPAYYQLVQIDGQVYQQWDAPPGFAAGWQSPSAFLGEPGNTVLNGHHNIFGSVFGHLVDLSVGDSIQIYSGAWVFTYQITNKMILQERGQDVSVRLQHASWLLPTTDQRLTLVTCWPPDNNTHRVIIVAAPVGKQLVSSGQNP